MQDYLSACNDKVKNNLDFCMYNIYAYVIKYKNSVPFTQPNTQTYRDFFLTSNKFYIS